MSQEHILIKNARKYINTPYFFKGRNKGGLDCSGLLIISMNSDYNFLDYNHNPNPNTIKKELLKIGNKVDYLESGNILLLSLYGLPQHIALYTSINTIIHTYDSIGKVIEEKYTYYWKNKVDSVYRIKEELICR